MECLSLSLLFFAVCFGCVAWYTDRVLRPELITLYSRQKAFEKLIAMRNKKEEEAKKKTADEKDKKKPDTKDKPKEAEKEKEKEKEKDDKEKEKDAFADAGKLGTSNEEDQTYIKGLAEITFNPDVFTNAKLADSEEK